MKKDYIFIFCLALFLRILLAVVLFYSFGEEGFITKDARGQYLPLAKNLALGNGFTLDGVNPYAYKAPGYPIFLAFFYKLFGVFWPAIAVQIILSALLAVLIFKIGEQIGFSKKINWAAAILTATGPHLIYYGNVYVTESLFAFLLLLGIFYFFKFLKNPSLKFAIISGLFLGIDTLVKVSTQFLPLAFLPFFIFLIYRSPNRKKLIVYCLVFLFIFAVVLTPLAIRNYIRFGTFSLSSQSAYLLYRYEGTSVVSVRDNISYGEAEQVARRELRSGTGLENVPENKLEDLKYAPVIYKKTVDLMKSNIGAVIKVELVNILSFWTHSNYAYIPSTYKIISPPFLPDPPAYLLARGEWIKAFSEMTKVIFNPYYLVAFFSRIFWILIALFVISGIGCVIFCKTFSSETRVLALSVFVMIIYYNLTLAPLGFGMEARLRYHVEPLMFLLSSFGFITLYNLIKNWYTSRRLKASFEN